MSQSADLSHSPVAPARSRRRLGRTRPGPGLLRELESPLRFLGAFVREPLSVGALWPSSKTLARAVVESCEFLPGATVVELGPGTGAFTQLLLERLAGQGRFLGVELNATNVHILRRRFPRCPVVEDSAENLPGHLNGHRAHCVVSGLAWGNMFPRTQNKILRAILASLAPGGQFVAFAYVHAMWFPTSLRFRRQLKRHFTRVETTPVIWHNLPPAYVFRCWRG